MKDTLAVMKNNLQGINSRVDEVENQINGLEYKEANNTSRTAKIKQNLKNEDKVRSFWETFKHTNICIMGVPKREERQQEIENLFLKYNHGKFPEPGEENRHTNLGSTESSKQDEPKEAHTKVHYN